MKKRMMKVVAGGAQAAAVMAGALTAQAAGTTISVAIWDNNQLSGLQQIADEWAAENDVQVDFLPFPEVIGDEFRGLSPCLAEQDALRFYVSVFLRPCDREQKGIDPALRLFQFRIFRKPSLINHLINHSAPPLPSSCKPRTERGPCCAC